MRLMTSDVRFATAIFSVWERKIASQVNLDVCLQNIEKVRKKFAVANWPSDVVSRIHVYVHLDVVFST